MNEGAPLPAGTDSYENTRVLLQEGRVISFEQREPRKA